MLRLPEHFFPTHQTGGLSGFPAVDVFGRAGALVVTPCAGVVVKLSGRKPTATTAPGGPYGYSIYLAKRVVNGVPEDVYYLTHFSVREPNVRTGARIKAGTVIGRVADYAKATHGVTPNHIHEGFHRGPWTPNT